MKMTIGNKPFARPTTWNPLDKGAGVTLSNANLTAAMTATANQTARSTSSRTSGKLYFEILVNISDGNTWAAGVTDAAYNPTTTRVGVGTAVGYGDSGGVQLGGSTLASQASYTSGDRIGVAVDFAAGKVWFAKNNTFVGSPTAGTGGYTLPSSPVFAGTSPQLSGQTTANFGATAFTYTPPTGFSAWG